MKKLVHPVALALSGAGPLFLPLLGFTAYAIWSGKEVTLRILLFLWVAFVFIGGQKRKRGTPLE